MKHLFTFVAPLIIAGCSLNTPIQRIVVDQNTLLAKTTDEVMLANVLRAMNNEPMHFSLVQTFHGSASLTAGLTLGATFPSNGMSRSLTQLMQPSVVANNTTTTTTMNTPAVNTLSPTATGSFTESPSFDATIIDSQNFSQGFLKPVSPAIVGHFLYDNWPSKLLTYLLVEKFELVAAYDYDENGMAIDPDPPKTKIRHGKPAPKLKPSVRKGTVVGYINNAIFSRERADSKTMAPGPTNPFVHLIDHFELTDINNGPDNDTPLFQVKNVTSLSGIEKIDGAAYDMKSGVLNRMDGALPTLIVSRFNGQVDHSNNYRIALQLEDHDTLPFYYVGAFSGPIDVGHGECDRVFASYQIKNYECATYINIGSVLTQGEVDTTKKFDDTDHLVNLRVMVKGKSISAQMRLVLKPVLRSPEAVFYFVGEYLRQQSEPISQSEPRSDLTKYTAPQDAPWTGCPRLDRNGLQIEQPLIVVSTKRPQHALLSAELDGTRYYIPDSRYECNGQSMKVLTLLEQLFYLQVSSADKLSVTPTVHIVP